VKKKRKPGSQPGLAVDCRARERKEPNEAHITRVHTSNLVLRSVVVSKSATTIYREGSFGALCLLPLKSLTRRR